MLPDVMLEIPQSCGVCLSPIVIVSGPIIAQAAVQTCIDVAWHDAAAEFLRARQAWEAQPGQTALAPSCGLGTVVARPMGWSSISCVGVGQHCTQGQSITTSCANGDSTHSTANPPCGLFQITGRVPGICKAI